MQTFCNDDDIRGIGFVNVDSGVQTSDLIDQVARPDYHVCNKMGTSIPNIFARMFLFSSAYNDISSLENKVVDNIRKYKGKAHNYSINPKNDEQYISVYHYLISEHLDMLEFLFYYGHELSIEKWTLSDFEKSFASLAPYDDSYDKLDRFFKAIRSAIVDDTPMLGGDANIDVLMFKYKDVIVGGTSPSLLVYTNPNWKREILEKDWKFNGLFVDSEPRPLHERSLPFRKLLNLLVEGGKLANASFADFREYVKDNRENGYDNAIKAWWRELLHSYGTTPITNWVDDEIGKLAEVLQWRDDNGNLCNVQSPIQGVEIYKQSPYHTFYTQYKIKPTRDAQHWETENVHGGNVILAGEPMLVVENGITGARYYETENWKREFAIPIYAQLKNQPLSEREVPGKKGLKYPILTVDDLLEENIAELAYVVDSEHFFTACRTDFSYMLPIKRMYFRFFTFEDLKTSLKIAVNYNDGSVNLTLDIPMNSVPGGKYTIRRTYSSDENARYKIVNCRLKNVFNMGIFPFYRMANGTTYRFMMGVNQLTNIECRLCNFDKVGFNLPVNYMQECNNLTFGLRSTRNNGAYKTYFASHDMNFDFVEFEIDVNSENGKLKGIFIPLMQTIQPGTDWKWAYSVDFGTSNTHVVMADTGYGYVNGAKKFEYDMSSLQMVSLGLPNNNRFQSLENDFVREFVPKAFGGGESLQQFPIRSVIYEKENHGINMELFTERNVGFNYKNELVNDFKCNNYISDLKWNIYGQAEFQCRIEAYCYQLLWMIRNHSLTNGGTEKIKVAVTYPISMRPAQLRVIKNAWNRAWRDLIDGNNGFPAQNFKSESVAPYKYSIDKDGAQMNRTDAYLNVDIGGGSTDILYYKETANRPTKSRAYSIFFAANDLWGNGVKPAHRKNKVNGFIKNLEKTLKANGDQTAIQVLANYKEVAGNSADVSTFLFSKPEVYHFKDNICQGPIASVVVMHFAATIYYIAKIIKTEGLSVPKYINFTGMGSKYLEIISESPEELANLIKVIFKLVKVDAENITVQYEKNPKEVTALGALYMLDSATTQVVLPQSSVVYCIDGEEDIDEALTYEYTQTEECMNKTMLEVEEFKKVLSSAEFNSAVSVLGLPYSYSILADNGLNKDTLESSYMTVKENVSAEGADTLRSKLMDAPFFWALKDTLYVIADRIATS